LFNRGLILKGARAGKPASDTPSPTPGKHEERERERRGNGLRRREEVEAQTRGRNTPNADPAAEEEDPTKGEPGHPAVMDPALALVLDLAAPCQDVRGLRKEIAIR
jgi:hypothetical protein